MWEVCYCQISIKGVDKAVMSIYLSLPSVGAVVPAPRMLVFVVMAVPVPAAVVVVAPSIKFEGSFGKFSRFVTLS